LLAASLGCSSESAAPEDTGSSAHALTCSYTKLDEGRDLPYVLPKAAGVFEDSCGKFAGPPADRSNTRIELTYTGVPSMQPTQRHVSVRVNTDDVEADDRTFTTRDPSLGDDPLPNGNSVYYAYFSSKANDEDVLRRVTVDDSRCPGSVSTWWMEPVGALRVLHVQVDCRVCISSDCNFDHALEPSCYCMLDGGCYRKICYGVDPVSPMLGAGNGPGGGPPGGGPTGPTAPAH
jgi:hypothetical protein